MQNPLNLIAKIFKKPGSVPAADLISVMRDLQNNLAQMQTPDNKTKMSKEDLSKILLMGSPSTSMDDTVFNSMVINYERRSVYKELDLSLSHWMMSSALECYSDYATVYSPIHDSTVWCTGDTKYVSKITNMLDQIGVEEKIFDWAWTIAAYGDLFVELVADPSLGIINIMDDDHPINVSRLDRNGVLNGFFRTPLGEVGQEVTAQLLPPWKFVHFRLLSTKRKRPLYGDPNFTEYRTMHLLSPDARRISTAYGTSVLMNALPIYKRLRMAEDSLLLTRLTRGIKRYIYKVKVDGSNIDSISAIIDGYKSLLKTARAINSSSSSPYFEERYDPMGSLEDLIVPVWDNVNDLEVEEIGGDADIRWIVDIEELRNQLASALRTPLSLLGGFVDEATGALGSSSIEKLDMRFARSARRLQRALIVGITRMAQIDLAYQGLDPDTKLFDIHMPETSTAEEEQLRESLDTAIDVVDKVLMTYESVFGKDLNKAKLLDYLNQKFLKLSDLNLTDYVTAYEGSDRDKQLSLIDDAKDELVHNKGRLARTAKSLDFKALTETKEGKALWELNNPDRASIKIKINASKKRTKGSKK